jgi:hypothetical protein
MTFSLHLRQTRKSLKLGAINILWLAPDLLMNLNGTAIARRLGAAWMQGHSGSLRIGILTRINRLFMVLKTLSHGINENHTT